MPALANSAARNWIATSEPRSRERRPSRASEARNVRSARRSSTRMRLSPSRWAFPERVAPSAIVASAIADVEFTAKRYHFRRENAVRAAIVSEGRSALATPHHGTAHDGHHRAAAKLPAMKRRVLTFRKGAVDVVSPGQVGIEDRKVGGRSLGQRAAFESQDARGPGGEQFHQPL